MFVWKQNLHRNFTLSLCFIPLKYWFDVSYIPSRKILQKFLLNDESELVTNYFNLKKKKSRIISSRKKIRKNVRTSLAKSNHL